MADIESNLPEAYWKDGKVLRYATSEELPNYEGLVGVQMELCNRKFCAVLHTYLIGDERHFAYVHEGIFLDMKTVEAFYKGQS